MEAVHHYGSDRGPHTIADLDSLSGQGKRYELAHGWLIEVSPSHLHDFLAEALKDLLRPHVPPEFVVKGPWDVLMPEGSLYSPDVVVLDADAYLRLALDDRRAPTGDDVLLAAEIQRPGSGSWKVVHHTKVRDYALAGIPHYWIVDLDEVPRLTVYKLDESGEYVQTHRVEGNVKADLDEPFPFTFAPASLMPHRSPKD
jgi:Uma2 family endonuclease